MYWHNCCNVSRMAKNIHVYPNRNQHVYVHRTSTHSGTLNPCAVLWRPKFRRNFTPGISPRLHRLAARTPQSSSGGADWWVKPAAYAVGAVIVIYIISQILPYLILAAIGYGALKFFGEK
jgi:hypothetical protein